MGKDCFSVIIYQFCSSNALCWSSLSFRLFSFRFSLLTPLILEIANIWNQISTKILYALTIAIMYFFSRSFQNGKKSKTVKQNYEALFTDQVEDGGTTPQILKNRYQIWCYKISYFSSELSVQIWFKKDSTHHFTIDAKY